MTACSPAAVTTDATQSADQLAEGLARHDASGFAGAFADTAVDRSRAARWFGLLTSSQGRLSVTNSDQLQVVSTLPGDRRPATERLRLVWRGPGEGFSVASDPGTPLWALEPATATSGHSGTVVTAAGDGSAGAWQALMARAVAAVRAADVVPADGWSGQLVVEAPASSDDFSLLTGTSAGASSAITSCRSGTPRIVLNPLLAGYDADVQFATLTHEAVHAAMDSPCQQGLAWAVEGVAESVAAQADPATAKANRALVRAYLAEHAVPSALPEHPSTPTDYALVQVAADELRTRLADRAPEFFERATRSALSADEIAQTTRWYREALRKLVG